VIGKPFFRRLLPAATQILCGEDQASQLVEFAVSLPLLVLFVVGIFDFSGAFTLKQKLTNIARDGARVAAADPASDLGGTFTQGSAPVSVVDVFNVVDNDLNTNQISDCGVTAASVTSSGGGLIWTYSVTATSSAPCGITLIVNRGYVFPASGAAVPPETCVSQTVGSQTAIVGTCVSIRYNYAWKFGRVSSLLGTTAALPSQISGVAVAMNEN
jgi:Flp pilus assembly protein TadG